MFKKLFKKKFVLSALVMSMAFVLSVQSAYAGKKNDTLTFASRGALGNVDKSFNTSRTGMIVQRLFTDGLLYTDPVTMEIKPALAASWKWINAKLLEFELRRGVKFHDGSEMTADDVVYTLRYVADPAVKTKGSYIKKIDRVEKLAPYKVRIHLKTPYPMMVNRLAGGVSIYKKGSYEKNGPLSQNLNPNGTGPYRLIKILDGKGFIFERFEDYYKESPKGQPAIRKIVVRIIKEINTQVAEVLSGGVDWIYQVPSDIADSLTSNPRVTVKTAPSMRIKFLRMDAAGRTGDDSPFKKLKVRQAVNHAVNREAIVKQLVKGSSKVIHSACKPIQFGCTEDVKRYEYSPEKARQLLKAAGYPDGFETKLYSFLDRPILETIMNDLAMVGIKVTLDYSTWPSLVSALGKDKVPLTYHGWGSSSLPDVDAILPFFFKLNAQDLSRDPEVNGLIKAGGSSSDPDIRLKNYNRALKLIAERAYWLPLFSDTMNYIHSNDLEFVSPQDGLPRLFLTKWKK